MRNHQTRQALTAITTTMMASVLSPADSLMVSALANTDGQRSNHFSVQRPTASCTACSCEP